jgi:hypothetical protein
MSLEKKIIKVKVIDKEELLPKSSLDNFEYSVVFRIIDKTIKNNPIVERKISLDQYRGLNIGDKVNIVVHTLNGSEWYFSKNEAEQSEKYSHPS